MKNNSIYIAVLFIMALFVVFLIYINNELDEQIAKRDSIIHRMQERESIIDSLLSPVKTDTTSYIFFYRNEEGKIIGYHQLDSLCHYYERQNAMLDFVILTAKKKYNFDYSIKYKNDTLSVKMWDKKYTIMINE